MRSTQCAVQAVKKHGVQHKEPSTTLQGHQSCRRRHTYHSLGSRLKITLYMSESEMPHDASIIHIHVNV